MTQTTTRYVAWATTSVSMPDADPGIAVTSYEDDDGHREESGTWHAVSGELATTWGQHPDDPDRLDEDAADAELAQLGYRRTEPWQRSGGQWAAEVESTR